MTVTATGTLARADCASTRSATFFARASKSMTVSFLMRIAREGKSGFGFFECVSLRGRVARHRIPGDFLRLRADESLARTKPYPVLRSRSRDRGHARVPAGSDLDIRRQAVGIHEALGVC